MATPTLLRRAGRLLLVALVAIVALTACIKVDADLTISEDGTVDGTQILAVDKQLLSLTGQTPETLQNSIEDAVADADIPSGASVEAEAYEDDTFVGSQLTLENVPVDQVDRFAGLAATVGNASTFSLTREGDTYRFAATLDYATTATLPQLPSTADRPAEVRIRFTFPGPVRESNGEIDGTSVTWRPVLGERTELTAVADAAATGGSEGTSATTGGDDDGGSSILPWVIVGVVVIAVVAGVVVFFTRRQQGPPSPPDTPAPPVTVGGGNLPPP